MNVPLLAQSGEGLVQLGSTADITVMVCVSVCWQAPEPTVYVTDWLPKLGSKVLPLTPVPLQVPPVVPVICRSRFIGGDDEHNELGVVQFASALGFTVMLKVEAVPMQLFSVGV